MFLLLLHFCCYFFLLITCKAQDPSKGLRPDNIIVNHYEHGKTFASKPPIQDAVKTSEAMAVAETLASEQEASSKTGKISEALAAAETVAETVAETYKSTTSSRLLSAAAVRSLAPVAGASYEEELRRRQHGAAERRR